MSGCWPCRRKRRVRKPTLSASGDVPKEVETTKVEKLKVLPHRNTFGRGAATWSSLLLAAFRPCALYGRTQI
eukprot:6179175-Pleurochrysis_carterae.AAC.1